MAPICSWGQKNILSGANFATLAPVSMGEPRAREGWLQKLQRLSSQLLMASRLSEWHLKGKRKRDVQSVFEETVNYVLCLYCRVALLLVCLSWLEPVATVAWPRHCLVTSSWSDWANLWVASRGLLSLSCQSFFLKCRTGLKSRWPIRKCNKGKRLFTSRYWLHI